jgi:hypothetical protein
MMVFMAGTVQAPAARITAHTIRRWVPQRQRLFASSALTCGSLGFGLRISSATHYMIMPLMR